MIIYTYEDYLKSILKLDISSVFLKKVLSREDEEECEEGHTTEFMLCDVSEKYIPDSPDEIDEKNKNNNTKEQNKNNEKTKTNENVKQNKKDTIKTSKSTINTKRNIRQQLKARRINNEHDKIFRTVLDKKTDVSKFLNKFLGLNIKTEELEKYNSSYIDPKFKNKEADIVYRIKDKNIFLLIEHQTKIDKDMPYRLLDYSNGIMRSASEDKKRPSVIPIVLYTGKTKWKIENETIEKQQFFKEVKLIDGEFNLIDINDFSKKELLEDDIFITKMMLVEKCKDEIEMVQALEKIENKIKEEDKSTFRRIVKEIWSLRIGTENANKILEKIEEGSGNMMAVMEMLLAENEKYINIGRQEGRQEGRLEGRLEGGKQKIKEIVQKMLAENFTKEMIMKITGLKKEEIEEIK